MKRLITAFAAFLIATPVLAYSPAKMRALVEQTNFLVSNNCSATLIDPNQGYLLTANHCIADQYDIVEKQKFGEDGKVTTEKVRVARPGQVSQLLFSGPEMVRQTSYVFHIVASDADHDLALIKVTAKIPNTLGAKVACVQPQQFDPVVVVGNPLGVLYSSATTGIVASIQRNYRQIGADGTNADYGLLQVTAAVGGGNSGGAVYNDEGELVGVMVRGYQNVSPLGLAVPLSDIRTFLGDKIEACK